MDPDNGVMIQLARKMTRTERQFISNSYACCETLPLTDSKSLHLKHSNERSNW